VDPAHVVTAVCAAALVCNYRHQLVVACV
jgi:hypothetical protein